MTIYVAAYIHRYRKSRNMRWISFNIYRQSRRGSAEAARTDAKTIYLFQ